MVFVDLVEVPVELVVGDAGGVNTEVIGQQLAQFFLLEGGVVVLVVGEEDRLEILLHVLLYVQLALHHSNFKRYK